MCSELVLTVRAALHIERLAVARSSASIELGLLTTTSPRGARTASCLILWCRRLLHEPHAHTRGAAKAVVAQTSPRPPLMREACESCTSRADVSPLRRSKLAHVLGRTSARVSATDGISWPLRAASGMAGGAGAWLWSRRRGEARALRRFSGRERPVDSVEARRTTRASFDRGKRSVSTSCTWI